ncbi:hypothetical protein KKF55_06525 [Patescibacteria group bacterium]|nr:hypothetical protein [Patescibacteria group bacterium]
MSTTPTESFIVTEAEVPDGNPTVDSPRVSMREAFKTIIECNGKVRIGEVDSTSIELTDDRIKKVSGSARTQIIEQIRSQLIKIKGIDPDTVVVD